LELKKEQEIESVSIYWYDDKGGVQLPAAWDLEYRTNGEWKTWELYNTDDYNLFANQYNMVHPAEAIKADGTGWTGTVFARVNIPSLPLYIQPELQYTNTTITIPIVTDNSQNTEKHTYIDLPVLLGAEFGLGSLASVRINAGPVFAIASEKGFGDLTQDDFVAAYNEPTMTWTAGLGVKVLSFIAEVRYNGNFVDGKIDTDNIMGSIDTNRTSWSLSLGVVF
jgi:hypothetical protein